MSTEDKKTPQDYENERFPQHPPCPTCGRRIFLNDELAKQLLPTCQRCQGYGYLVNSSDGSKSKCPECSLPPKLHINPKWSKEEIIQCVDEYNAELLVQSPLPDEEIKNAIPKDWDANEAECFVSGVTWCKEWLVDNLWKELTNIKEQFTDKKEAPILEKRIFDLNMEIRSLKQQLKDERSPNQNINYDPHEGKGPDNELL